MDRERGTRHSQKTAIFRGPVRPWKRQWVEHEHMRVCKWVPCDMPDSKAIEPSEDVADLVFDNPSENQIRSRPVRAAAIAAEKLLAEAAAEHDDYVTSDDGEGGDGQAKPRRSMKNTQPMDFLDTSFSGFIQETDSFMS
eukprot:TRINITY_DN19342_c0_g1::TRINITY_DN19342_c0_g1_i1::g.7899::m.7899 TRINITY_DN19342_c0_g1::TRINITY_DN19342_c0_g1_i1::g.7899  ORF type:complete len:139 (-),score=14.04,BCL_N/PF04714.8/0.14 TRINITY_DN19342_c0_g1_i1:1033-1449(-)